MKEACEEIDANEDASAAATDFFTSLHLSETSCSLLGDWTVVDAEDAADTSVETTGVFDMCFDRLRLCGMP